MPPRNVIGGVLAVLIAVILYSVFSAKEESPSLDHPKSSPATVRRADPPAEAQPEVSYPSPKTGPNPALARAQQMGDLAPGKAPLAPRVPEAINRPSSPPSPSAAQAGDAVTPKKPWPIDKEGIRGAVNEALPEIKECYEEWLKVSPNLGGKVVVTFTIKAVEGEESGKVTQVALADQSTIGHKPMEGCVLSVVEDLKFARPADGEIKITYPMLLANGEADAGR